MYRRLHLAQRLTALFAVAFTLLWTTRPLAAESMNASMAACPMHSARSGTAACMHMEAMSTDCCPHSGLAAAMHCVPTSEGCAESVPAQEQPQVSRQVRVEIPDQRAVEIVSPSAPNFHTQDHIAALQRGLRFEPAVFDLKADLRI